MNRTRPGAPAAWGETASLLSISETHGRRDVRHGHQDEARRAAPHGEDEPADTWADDARAAVQRAVQRDAVADQRRLDELADDGRRAWENRRRWLSEDDRQQHHVPELDLIA